MFRRIVGQLADWHFLVEVLVGFTIMWFVLLML